MKTSLLIPIHILLLVFYCVQPSAAQMSDSFYNYLHTDFKPKNKNQLTHDERLKMINGLGADYISRYGKEVFALAAEGIKIADTTKNLLLKIKYTLALATFYVNRDDYSKASNYYHRVILLSGNNPQFNEQVSESYVQQASMYSTNIQMDSAIDYLHKALDIRKNRDSVFLCRVYNAYELIYEYLGLYEQSIGYSKKYNETLPHGSDWDYDYTFTIYEIARKYANLYRETRQKEYSNAALEMVNQVKEKQKRFPGVWYASCYFIQGQLKFYDNEYKSAIQYFDSCLMPAFATTEVAGHNLLNACRLYRAVCLLRSGDKSALKILDTLPVSTRNFISQRMKFKALYEYEHTNGNWKKALEYYTQYIAASDSMDIIKTRGKIFEANQKYSVVQKEVQIKSLENKNLSEIQTKTKIAVVSVSIVVALVLTIMALYTHNKRQQSKRMVEQQRLMGDLQNLELEMEQAQLKQQLEREVAIENQRKTISKDMHDGISSGLAALKYYVEDLENSAAADAKKALHDVKNEVGALYQQAREYMQQLAQKPGIIVSSYNVINLLKNLSERFNDTLVLQVKTTIDEKAIEQHFSVEQHHEMCLIIKEAVANIIKHSGATEANIAVSVTNDHCSFSIADNGRGFDIQKARYKGMGLQSILERVKKLQGTLNISSKNTGTVLSGNFPLGV